MGLHVELEFSAKTDTGLVRQHNEDAIAISEKCGFAILADGMGGYNAGEIASGIATSVLKEALEERLDSRPLDGRFIRSHRLHQIITASIEHTNASIIEAARIEPEYCGMGTTLAAALFHYNKVTIAHIGDSRVYRLRGNEFTQLTRDHSLLQEQIDAGIITHDEARTSQNKNLITRALGVEYPVQIEVHDHATALHDLYLLCSDGLSDMLEDLDIQYILKNHYSDLNAACNALIDGAKTGGGRDNISVVLVKVKSSPPSEFGARERISGWLKSWLVKANRDQEQ